MPVTMNILYFAIPVFLFSCSKPVKDNCFTDKSPQLYNKDEDSQLKFTVQQILKDKPSYLQMESLPNYRDFKKDSTEYNDLNPEYVERRVKLIKDGDLFNEKFGDFSLYVATQQIGNTFYTLAENSLGYWLLKIENGKRSAYFLGMSRDQYYFNRIQQRPVIDGEYVQAEGSLGNRIESEKSRIKKGFSALEDGKLFRIKLKDIEQDSDQDGYNDIFEKSFGLNPYNKDTDGDGINDSDDMNPMYTSENNKWSEFYNHAMIFEGPSTMSEYGKEYLKYTFSFFKGDCDYLHQMSPSFRVLFIPEDKNKQTAYMRTANLKVTYFSKLFQDKKNPETFSLSTQKQKRQDLLYSLEYKQGKWQVSQDY